MNKKHVILAFIALLTVCLVACGSVSGKTESTAASTVSPRPMPTQTEIPPTTVVTEPLPLHSPLYIEGLDVEEVIRYFKEVCLDAEITISGDPSVLQKWLDPIYYMLHGSPTDDDIATLNDFTAWLNTIAGFPGIYETKDALKANLQIHFCTQQDMLVLMGEGFTNMDGAVTFWYRQNVIYNAIICYRTDLNQTLRNSVILEEIYNGLGPIQDTQLRPDSIIYSEYSEPQRLTEVDELILKLLYHPQLQCGMNAAECEAVIRQLYY